MPRSPATEPQDPGREQDPRAQIDRARERAAATHKRVAVIFGADWCPDCGALDTALGHPLVQPIVEPAFEVVKVDVGNRDRHLELAADLGISPLRGIPAVSVLEADGRVVTALGSGELSNARSMGPVEIATVFHRVSR